MKARTSGVGGLVLGVLLGAGGASTDLLPAELLDGVSPQQLYASLHQIAVPVAPSLDLQPGAELDLQARVTARSKMSPRLAAMAAAGEARRLRVAVELAPSGVTNAVLGPERLAALGGRPATAQAEDSPQLIDLPGESLDVFALEPAVRRLSLIGVVAAHSGPFGRYGDAQRAAQAPGQGGRMQP